MPEGTPTARTEPPRLPWYATVILLVAIMVVAVVRPWMPQGFVEFAFRLAGRPLSLEMGNGTSLTLIEEKPLTTGCQASALGWNPDGTALVTACPNDIQIWTRDGHEIGSRPAAFTYQQYIQVLVDPFRVAYFGASEEPTVRGKVLTIWNVGAGGLSTLPVRLEASPVVAIDQDQVRVAVADVLLRKAQVRLLSLDGGEIANTLQVPSWVQSLRWIPGSDELLMAGLDGVLRLANVATGDVRELASPYTTSFPGGGSVVGIVRGLVTAPGGRSIALFGTGSLMSIAGRADSTAAQKWEETLGTTVEIRSVNDGRLLDRMPGPEAGVSDLAWDPRDRFIAVAGRDALFLWHRQSATVVAMTYGGPMSSSISHSVAITSDGTRLALTTAKGVRIFRIDER
jgi:WD40 repeat protein